VLRRVVRDAQPLVTVTMIMKRRMRRMRMKRRIMSHGG
jgi:hypothetical protein